MSEKLHIIIACGGTGGHLFPGIAVAEELKRQGHDVMLLISEKKVDAESTKKYGDLKFETVTAIAKPATLSLKMLPFMIKLWKSIRQSKALLKKHQTDIILGMGGFTSLPPILAGKQLGLKTFVHDSNALPGKANRLTSRWCKKVLIGLEAAAKYFPNSAVVTTGTPIRTELESLPEQSAARAKFGLNASNRTVLVMGGSQGAKHLNTLVVDTAKAMPDIQFLHITGTGDYKRVQELAKDRDGYHVLAFCDDMAAAYAASDLSVCRSGASSLTELSCASMPSILVPYPHAADDHQTVNAEVFEQAGAAILRQEKDLDSGELVTELFKILENGDTYSSMSSAANQLAKRDAAQRICKEIIS